MKMTTAKRLFRTVKRFPVNTQIGVLDMMRASKPGRAAHKAGTIETVEGVSVPAWWFNRQDAGRGTLVFTHGGGYIAGPLQAHWDWVIALCNALGVAGVLVDYRRSREAPFPAALDDCAAVVARIDADGELGHGRWAIAGDSAGGGIAITLTRRLVDADANAPACLILASPFVDADMHRAELDSFEAMDDSLTLAFLRRCVDTYAPGADLTNAELSPIHGMMDGMPPQIISAGSEVLLPDLRRYRDKLDAAGIDNEYIEDLDGIHAYPLITRSETAQATIARQVSFTRRHLGLDRAPPT
ncbi:MAG: alpha/beta hydrolase fold domain-containing protein [Pseudomonadota bacterium]